MLIAVQRTTPRWPYPLLLCVALASATLNTCVGSDPLAGSQRIAQRAATQPVLELETA